VEKAPVEIGDHTFIGANATILMGTKIGSHSIIGAGAVVTKDVPDFSCAAGAPAKIVGKVVIKNNTVSVEYFNKKQSKKK